VLWEPQADARSATKTSTDKSKRFPNMESLPGRLGALLERGPGGAGAGREPLCYPNPTGDQS
jgi:hypothetical protein